MQGKIILTGFMASGKTTVGKAIARRLRWRFVDSDSELRARAGKSIDRIFAEDGEPHFRELERRIIAELAADPGPAVIATGGGALVDEENYRALVRSGVIVCLTARPEIIAKRVKRSAYARPKLVQSGKPLREAIAELMAARSEAYARAEITVDTSDLSIAKAAERVIEALALASGTHRCERSA